MKGLHHNKKLRHHAETYLPGLVNKRLSIIVLFLEQRTPNEHGIC